MGLTRVFDSVSTQYPVFPLWDFLCRLRWRLSIHVREECVALPPAPGTEIDSGRKDDEDALCKIKFDDPNVIFCPALHSTNPGTDYLRITDWSFKSIL